MWQADTLMPDACNLELFLVVFDAEVGAVAAELVCL